jgi:prepilin-type N-terminal cleavage/methylation domain-containing protein
MMIRRTFGSRRRGFSFVEVMFAVTLLGVGFVMFAAMLPVTIRQTQWTAEESVGANVARSALAALQADASDETMPENNGALSVFDPDGELGDRISAADPRYAWVALYRRGGGAVAQVYVVAVRARATDAFTGADLAADPDDATGLGSNLSPRPVGVRLEKGVGGGPDRVRLAGGAAGDATAAAAPGAYLIVADDDPAVGAHVYQLGSAIDATEGLWELAPGGDLTGASGAGVAGNSSGFLFGRGFAEPGRAAGGFSGPAQDVACYAGFVTVR